MVAGNTKKVIVIKNISSNLIEEAILILKNEPGAHDRNQVEKKVQRSNVKTDYILREAESIINQYIKENGLERLQNRRSVNNKKMLSFNIPVNVLINLSLMAAIAFLIYVVSKMM